MSSAELPGGVAPAAAPGEADLIRDYFRDLGPVRGDVALGIGDDAALLTVPPDAELVLTTDALVEGVHFPAGAPPRSLGHRALAVNLSDIAAMGASPSWMLLALNLPATDRAWLQEFCAGLGALAHAQRVALVGGNLSRGALSLTLELAGLVPRGQALRRDGARPGDELYVSGTPGEAAGGRALLGIAATGPAPVVRVPAAAAAALMQRFEYPQPRVALGQALRGIASACIDVSDGLYADAARLLAASGCGGEIEAERVPLSAPLRQAFGAAALGLALGGGEDYELCFTAAPGQAAAIELAARRTGAPVTRIGAVRSGAGLAVKSSNPESVMQFSARPFDHFSG